MTKEELRKEATTTVEWECTPMIGRPIFINGYITSAEPREKRIAELEAQIERNKIDLAISEHDREHDDYEFTEVYTKIEQLEKEIAELDCQKNRNKACYSCANATERCFKNEIGCPCEKYKSYKDENAELKEKVSYL